MIENTPTFQYQLYECFRGQPGGKDTRLTILYLKKSGRRVTAAYKKKAYLRNPVFPVELYEYRRDSQIHQVFSRERETEFLQVFIVSSYRFLRIHVVLVGIRFMCIVISL